MDFCNNYPTYRHLGATGPPSGFHHHAALHPAAMRYHHSGGHHQTGQSLYHRGPYYGSTYYDAYQPNYQNYPGYHHYPSYANLREGFGGSYNAQYSSYNAYYSSSYHDSYSRPYQPPALYRDHHHPFYSDPGSYSPAASKMIDVLPPSKTSGSGYFGGATDLAHYDKFPMSSFQETTTTRSTDNSTPTTNNNHNNLANSQVTNNNNNNLTTTATDSTSTTPNSTDHCASPRSDSSSRPSSRRLIQKDKLTRKNISSTNFTQQPHHDPYDYPNYSPNDARVPNSCSPSWQPGSTHSWSPGPGSGRVKKGLPLTDLELMQSSFDHHHRGLSQRRTHKMSSECMMDGVQAKRRKRQNQKEDHQEVKSNLTPLPGFQEAFGSTEIGRFSDVFFQLPESPMDHHVESDIDTMSPHPWEAGDSLEGPHFNLRVGASLQTVHDRGSDGSPYDNYFSEVSCNEF